MNFILKMLISAAAVMVSAWMLPGVTIDGNSFFTALLVAVVLAFLNAVVKPLLTLLTIPITVFTMGLFLLVINALMIIIVDKLVDGFHVNGFWWALLFSLILSLVTSIFDMLQGRNNQNPPNDNQ